MAQNEITYFRVKARQFRILAQAYQMKISEKLVEIADELEAHARKLERGESEGSAASGTSHRSSSAGERLCRGG